MTTSVLKRTDADLFKFVTDDPWAVAEKLGDGHVFDVQVVAMLYGQIEDFEQKLQHTHVTNGWYHVSLQQVATTWAEITDKAFEEKPASNHEPDSDQELPNCFELCLLVDAPPATYLKKRLVSKVGKAEAAELLNALTQTTSRQGTTVVRIYTFQNQGIRIRHE